MTSAVLFIVIALILCGAAVLAILGVGQLALSGVDAIERDGLARGMLAPAWSLVDSAGLIHQSPPAGPLQLIVFADHSLKSFPSVVDGLRALRDEAGAAGSSGRGDLEIVILMRGRSEIAEPVLGQLGLGGIPVLTGSAARYADYNVRVIPFAIFVDSVGRVRASSLVNHDWQLAKLQQIAAIPLEVGELATARRGRARLRRAPAPDPAPASTPASASAPASASSRSVV